MSLKKSILKTLFILLTSSQCLVSCNFNNLVENKTVQGRGFAKNCETGYSVMCFKLDVVSFIEKMSDSQEYNILPGVSIARDTNVNETKTDEIVLEMARSFPNDPEKRLDGFLLSRLTNYLQSHILKLKLVDSQVVEEARQKNGMGTKGMGNLAAAALMMKGTLGALALGALAALAGKALLTALLALVLSAIVGLKSLTSGHKHTTYEVIAKPVYTHTQSHSASHEDVHAGHGHSAYGSYGRSLNFELPSHLTQK